MLKAMGNSSNDETTPSKGGSLVVKSDEQQEMSWNMN